MRLTTWLEERDGIGHRDDASDAGFTPSHVRAAIRSGSVRRIRAKWIALDSAAPELVTAAFAGGALTCTTLARRRGWWVPPGVTEKSKGDEKPSTIEKVHLHLPVHESLRADDVTAHWAKPLTPRHPRMLEASVEDALSDVAPCFEIDQAVATWESAIRTTSTTLESLRSVRWRSAAARRCLLHVRPGTDSSLETVFHVRLSAWGVRLRLQVQLAGHPVDFLIGTHLVVQIDGWSFHSSSADRTRDVAHDAELRMRGYTVLRFSYPQVMFNWEHVEHVLASAISRGLHLATA